jgi:hypothetical protein
MEEYIFEQEKGSSRHEYLIFLCMALVVGTVILTVMGRAWKATQKEVIPEELPPSYPENEPVPEYTIIDFRATIQEPPPAYI